MKCSELDIVKDNHKYFVYIDTNKAPCKGYIITPIGKETFRREYYHNFDNDETKYVFYVVQEYEIRSKEIRVNPVERKSDSIILEEDCSIYEIAKSHLLSRESTYYTIYSLYKFYLADHDCKKIIENLELYLGKDWDK